MGAQHTITAGSEPRVPLDIKALKQSEGRPLIEPRDIFAALGGRPWPRLRVEQDQVLKSWFARRNRRDLVIKQNTGGGKTVVGLLAAQSSLNEGVGTAAYLVPDTYLVKQGPGHGSSIISLPQHQVLDSACPRTGVRPRPRCCRCCTCTACPAATSDPR